MNKNEPVNARIRLAIAQWPDDAPRGAVTTFCAEHEITRKTFYAIRARAGTVELTVVRHEALVVRMEVEGLRRLVIVVAG